jgi:hypothetical protein
LTGLTIRSGGTKLWASGGAKFFHASTFANRFSVALETLRTTVLGNGDAHGGFQFQCNMLKSFFNWTWLPRKI